MVRGQVEEGWTLKRDVEEGSRSSVVLYNKAYRLQLLLGDWKRTTGLRALTHPAPPSPSLSRRSSV